MRIMDWSAKCSKIQLPLDGQFFKLSQRILGTLSRINKSALSQRAGNPRYVRFPQAGPILRSIVLSGAICGPANRFTMTELLRSRLQTGSACNDSFLPAFREKLSWTRGIGSSNPSFSLSGLEEWSETVRLGTTNKSMYCYRSSVPLLCHCAGPEQTLLDKFLQRAVRQVVDKERLISSLSGF